MTLWMVDDDAFPGIHLMHGDVIIHKHHYVLLLQPSFPQYLICVTNIRLYMYVCMYVNK